MKKIHQSSFLFLWKHANLNESRSKSYKMTGGEAWRGMFKGFQRWKAHDPESVFFSPNFICDSNLWKLISFFRETRINSYLINFLRFFPRFFLLAISPPFRKKNTQKVCINILPDFILLSCETLFINMRDEAWVGEATKKSEIKLPMKIHTNRERGGKRHKKSTTFFEY